MRSEIPDSHCFRVRALRLFLALAPTGGFTLMLQTGAAGLVQQLSAKRHADKLATGWRGIRPRTCFVGLPLSAQLCLSSS